MKKLFIMFIFTILLFADGNGGYKPGFGTVMMEYGNRFYILYYAAKANNWDLAKYQLKELLEIQEVGEKFHPKYAMKLKDFEKNYLFKLEKDIKEKNFKSFDKNYKKSIKACNRCHMETGHPYIQYRLPLKEPSILKMGL